MHITAIDIGTNTVLGLGVEIDGARLWATSDEMDIVRLGEGLDATGMLSDGAMARALAVLERHGRALAARGGIGRKTCAAAVATESVRKAKNSDAFLVRARNALGFDVEVIDGEREAALGWLATSRSLGRAPNGRRTVLDIGGGSSELMIGSDAADRPERALSMPIGSVRLTERIMKTDPVSEEETRALIAIIDAALDGAPRPEGDLVGVAGTVTSLAAISLQLAVWDPERVHGYRMSVRDVEDVVTRLGRMRHSERKQVVGLDEKRADVIYAGGMILLRVLARAETREVIVSDRGVRWGLAYEIAERAEGRRFH